MRAIYQGIDGVALGTDVLLAGIKIGKVTKLDYVLTDIALKFPCGSEMIFCSRLTVWR